MILLKSIGFLILLLITLQVFSKNSLRNTLIQETLKNLKSMSQTTTVTNTGTKTLSLSLFKSNDHTNSFSKKTFYSNFHVKGGRYLVKLYVGTPPQEISALMDTGSTLFFVTSTHCHENKNCKVNSYFDFAKSKSFKGTSLEVSQKYAAGELSGYIGFDNVIMNNIRVRNQSLALLNKTDTVDAFDSIGALIGISYPDESEPNGNLFENMIEQKLLARNIIGYYINDEKKIGSITFGFLEDSKYKGKLHRVPVIGDHRWTIKVDEILINNKPTKICTQKFCKAMIDTGTSGISISKKIFNIFKDKIDIHENCEGYKNAPDITFVINGVNYTLKKEDYIIRHKDGKQISCENMIEGYDLTDDDDVFLIGETFLNKYYTVFDRDTDSIHFALRR